ncbi:MAG: hypothetical protein Q9201_006828, partial [Fulgogasparrea decipioides]
MLNLTSKLDFLGPFLLPSLAAGLIWFAHRIWETKESSDIIDSLMPALHTLLLKPSSMSPDSSAMHSAVLAIAAESLDEALTHAQRQHKLRVDIAPLLDVLKPHMQKHRHEAAALTELETWTTTQRHGLASALNMTMRGLMAWNMASAGSTDMSPPSYTHRLLLRTLDILGAKATLKILIDEIMARTEDTDSQESDMILDIVVTMILAPQPATMTTPPVPNNTQHLPQQHRLTLRDVLRTQSTLEVNEFSKTDPARARTIVRLHRRVEAFFIGTATTTAGMNAADPGNVDVLGMDDVDVVGPGG